LTSALTFSPDNTIDIGAAAATRPRHAYLGGDIWAGTSLRLGSGASANFTLQVTSNRLTYVASVTSFGHVFSGSTAAGSLALTFFQISPVSNTAQTLSTEINGFSFDTFTRQWATGAITNQREFAVNAPTYAFVGASTITTAATLYVSGAPIAGANATITNSHAAIFGARIRVDSAAALGGGAAPTVGTIGGSGPATAAQNEWIEIWTQNGKRFVPAWA